MTNDEETPNTEAAEEMVLAKPDVVYVFKLSQRSRIAGGN